MTNQQKPVIVLVAGGTGGHLFPAEALAGELEKRGYVVHLATDVRAERFVRNFAKDHVHIIPSATIKGKNPFALLKTLWQLVKGVRASRRLFRQFRPQLVGGFGGYPTLPPLYAAHSMGIISFIHEQNAVMGRANKAMATKVNAIAGGFLPIEGEFADKIVVTGNPLREAVIKAAKTPYQVSKGDEDFNLLVFGGSQGASFFGEILPKAIGLLSEAEKSRLKLVLQARGDSADLISAFKHLAVRAEVAPFFDDMAVRIANAQFIIARSGASTVSEIAAIGRPALLVPYPYALDHDQAANAATLAATSGVKVVAQQELDAQKLADIIKIALNEPDLLATQAQAAKAAGKVNATNILADLAEALLQGHSVKAFKDKI